MKKMIRVSLPEHLKNINFDFNKIVSKISINKNNMKFKQYFIMCPICKQYVFANSKSALLYNSKSHLEKHKRLNVMNTFPKKYGKIRNLKGGIS